MMSVYDMGRPMRGPLPLLTENERGAIRAQVYPRIPKFDVIQGGLSDRPTANNDEANR